MNREQIIEAVKNVTERARKLPKLGDAFTLPRIEFYSKSTVSGRAHYKEHKVSFNEVLARENPDKFMNTVIHEVAHLVTRKLYPKAKQSHGPEFKYVMSILGGRPNTTHSYDVKSVKREIVRPYNLYKCVCLGKVFTIVPNTHRQIEAGKKTLRCVKCHNAIRPVLNADDTFKIVMKSNLKK